jgi:hypothetical protein
MTGESASGGAIELSRLVEEFEAGRPRGGFHHVDHVQVAFAYIAEFPFLEAVGRFCAALRRFAVAQGKPNLYHETITWAYMILIRERMARVGQEQSWEEFAGRNRDLLVWKDGILSSLYSREELDSDLAREVFLLPRGSGAESGNG